MGRPGERHGAGESPAKLREEPQRSVCGSGDPVGAHIQRRLANVLVNGTVRHAAEHLIGSCREIVTRTMVDESLSQGGRPPERCIESQ